MRRLIKIIAVLILVSYEQKITLATPREIENTMLIQKANNNKEWLDKPEGFLWYNEEIMQQIKKPLYLRSKLSSKGTLEPYDQRIERLKQRFNRAQRKALDNPTLENVIKAQRLQKLIMDKSQKFAAMWQLASLIDDKLTNSLEPANSLHKRLYQERIEKENTGKLRKLSKDWGLILQVNNNCSYCHAFAPIVQQFADNYGFQLLFVTNSNASFQNMRIIRDTGLLHQLNPQHIVPVLYLVASSGKRIYPISRGITSGDKIIENIMSIIKMDDQNLAIK